MKKYVFALLSIGFIIFGCKKDDDNNSGDEKMKLITSATWKYDTIGIDGDKNGTIDQALPPGFIDNCDKDNTITFKSDSTGTLNEGATKCNSSDPQTTSFKWWFKENATVLYTPDQIFGTSYFSGDVKIGDLSSTRLRLIKDVTYPPYGTYTVILDLKH